MKSDKIELIKRIVRKNNYHNYDKSHKQCLSLGISIDVNALSRFATKLELIDRAELVKKQQELNEIQFAQGLAQSPQRDVPTQISEPPSTLPESPPTTPKSASRHVAVSRPNQEHPVHRMRHMQKRRELTYEQVKQREAEITFELGELKIRESELLQELLSLSQMLEDNQFN